MKLAAPDLSRQATIARSVAVVGRGLHSGAEVRARLRPAPVGFGWRFVRIDLDGAPAIAVSPQALESGVRCTALAAGAARVRTVEHLLAACLALGIDNLTVDLDAEELPILDGSALEWVRALDEAGRSEQDAPRAFIQLAEPVFYSEGVTTLLALPAERLSLTVVSLTDHPVAGRQWVELTVEPVSFRARLAPARTFCFREEVEALLARGLARGGSLENALVVNADGYSAPLRVPQELAAHKALDLLGDLATLGRPLRAQVVAVCPGHAANQQLVRQIENPRVLVELR